MKLAGWSKGASGGSKQIAALKNSGQPQQLVNTLLKMVFLGFVKSLICNLK